MKEIIQTSTMKILIYTLLLSVVMVLGSCVKIRSTPVCYTAGNETFSIDMPEEWPGISGDSTKPELMVVWQDTVNNVIHLKWDN